MQGQSNRVFLPLNNKDTVCCISVFKNGFARIFVSDGVLNESFHYVFGHAAA